MKRCPSCAEQVQSEALVCRHCGRGFSPDDFKSFDKEARARRVLYLALAVIFGVWLFKPSDTGETNLIHSLVDFATWAETSAQPK